MDSLTVLMMTAMSSSASDLLAHRRCALVESPAQLHIPLNSPYSSYAQLDQPSHHIEFDASPSFQQNGQWLDSQDLHSQDSLWPSCRDSQSSSCFFSLCGDLIRTTRGRAFVGFARPGRDSKAAVTDIEPIFYLCKQSLMSLYQRSARHSRIS